MKAIIPAAGLGTRFLPVARVVPKEMLPIGAKPALELIVDEARAAGASAKFAGSGGAIVGTYEDDAQYAALERDLAAIGCKTLKPSIATTADETAPLVSFANWRNS